MKALVYQGKQMRAVEPPNTDYPVTNRRRSQGATYSQVRDRPVHSKG